MWEDAIRLVLLAWPAWSSPVLALYQVHGGPHLARQVLFLGKKSEEEFEPSPGFEPSNVGTHLEEGMTSLCESLLAFTHCTCRSGAPG